jgi:nucleotide-binding universal stress UspA family protein
MAVTYKTILYCTDFSEAADYALKVAWDLAERHQARLYCLHILPAAYRFFPDEPGAEEKKEEGPTASTAAAEKAKTRMKGLLKKKGLAVPDHRVEWEIRCGVPFVEIVRCSRERQVDCIVLGAAGSSNIRRIAYGSTAENVARRAHCTVVITRNPERGY